MTLLSGNSHLPRLQFAPYELEDSVYGTKLQRLRRAQQACRQRRLEVWLELGAILTEEILFLLGCFGAPLAALTVFGALSCLLVSWGRAVRADQVYTRLFQALYDSLCRLY